MIITTVNNEEKIKYEPQIINIDEKNYIKKIILEKRGNEFTDVIFNNCGIEKFIGRYNNDIQNIKVLYNNGRVLVYSDKYIKEKNGVQITNVYTLYDILDDVCYSMTEEDLLKTFDPTLDSSYLKNSNKLIIRSDVEKRHRLRK